jgi:hypothetical protein
MRNDKLYIINNITLITISYNSFLKSESTFYNWNMRFGLGNLMGSSQTLFTELTSWINYN